MKATLMDIVENDAFDDAVTLILAVALALALLVILAHYPPPSWLRPHSLPPFM